MHDRHALGSRRGSAGQEPLDLTNGDVLVLVASDRRREPFEPRRHRGIIEHGVDGFVYEWEQATFNPVTNLMQCYIHFAFKDKSRLDRAYSYRWRLWGAAEIRDLLQEAGFATSLMYLQAFDPETDEPTDEYVCTDECEDHACWLGYIVALR